MAQLSALQQREQEYRRLNEAMEQKTAVLMQEAEQMLKKHEALLADRGPSVAAANEESRSASEYRQNSSKITLPQGSFMAAVDLGEDDLQSIAEVSSVQTKLQRRVLVSATDRTSTSNNTKGTTIEEITTAASSSRKSAPLIRAATIAIDGDEDVDGSAIPATAGQMSIEAQLRFYKAKVRVLQEELDRTQQELATRSREADATATKLQESDEDRNRLTRQVATLQQTLTKQKKLADDNEARATALERNLEVVRRDAESARRDQKKVTGDKSAQEVRLNRAMEEAEHLRQELAKARALARDANTDESRRVEKLTAEVRKLERQRTELIAAFKKSLKLIDVLKRQKLHLEAARMLHFREEEFIRALDWDRPGGSSAPAFESNSAPADTRNKKPVARRIPSHSVSNKTSSAAATANLNLVVEGTSEPSIDDFGGEANYDDDDDNDAN